MATAVPFLLLTTILAFLPGLYDCSHVAKNSFREQGTFETPLGPRSYEAVSQLKMPVVQWAHLEADGIKIAECSAASMTFEGKLDPEDFAAEVVIAIPKKLFASLGCPLPSSTDDVLEREQVIFKQIISAAHRSRFITVRTRFVSGRTVVPRTTVEIGSLVASGEKQVLSNRQVENTSDFLMGTSSRNGILGLLDEKRTASFNLTENVKIDAEATVSGGVCELIFDNIGNKVDILMSLSANLLGTLTLDESFSDRRSGVLLKEPLPDLGVSLNFGLIGQVSFGVLFALEYVAELDLNAEFTASFSASYTANATITVGLSTNIGSAQHMGDSVGQRSASLTPKFQVDAANFSANLFVGLRPEIEVELEGPIIGEFGVKFGGTVGLEAKATYQEPPLAPIAGRTDICGACHRVGGSLDLVGRRLSATVLLPFFNDQDFVLVNRMFDISILQLCYYGISCPSTIEIEPEQCISPESSVLNEAQNDNDSAIEEQFLAAQQAEQEEQSVTAGAALGSTSQVDGSGFGGASQVAGVSSAGSQEGDVSSGGGSQEGDVSSGDGSQEGDVSSGGESQEDSGSSEGGSQGGSDVSSEVIAPPADGPTVNEEEEEEEEEKSGSESSDKSGSEKSDSEKSGSDSDSDSGSDSDSDSE